MKKLLNVILTMSFLFVNIVNVNASAYETEDELLKAFYEKVYASDYYKQFENRIVGDLTGVVNENDQVTVAFILDDAENPTKTLLFTGNDLLDFEQVIEIENTGNNISINDLLTESRTRAHLGWCEKYTCSRKQSGYYYNAQPGCSAMVGQPCGDIAFLPVYGWALSLLCRGGVWVTCNFEYGYRCIQYQKTSYECTIV